MYHARYIPLLRYSCTECDNKGFRYLRETVVCIVRELPFIFRKLYIFSCVRIACRILMAAEGENIARKLSCR